MLTRPKGFGRVYRVIILLEFKEPSILSRWLFCLGLKDYGLEYKCTIVNNPVIAED